MPDPVLKEEMAGCWPHPYILLPLIEGARLCRPASIRIHREPNGSMLVGVLDSVGAAIWPTGSTTPQGRPQSPELGELLLSTNSYAATCVWRLARRNGS
jgi:hypothetical protein